jgi:FKBP-type peptidyl-prolyl cis-trans isomerase SlyD
MIISDKTVVSVNYKLTISSAGKQADEELVEETQDSNPFVFLYGSGGLLEEFEKNLHGLTTGELFDFVIKSDQGYGISSDENIIKLPIHAFKAEGEELDTEMVRPGNFIPMVDEQGHQLQGLVVSVNDDYVVMDFNHPLAGKDLHFTGSVRNVRQASAEELAHGHVHGEGGHHH